jgi:hypothetical protein
MATNKNNIAVGAGLAAAAAAVAAGAYWLYGAEDATKHRKQVKSWMLKARAEVMDAIEKMEDIDKQKYIALVQEVVGKYSKMSGVEAAEVALATRDLKSAWQHMEKTKKRSGTAKAKRAVKKIKSRRKVGTPTKASGRKAASRS